MRYRWGLVAVAIVAVPAFAQQQRQGAPQQPAGRVAQSAVGRAGERTERRATGDAAPTARLETRLQTRVDSRLRTRVDRDYDAAQASPTATLAVAQERSRASRRAASDGTRDPVASSPRQ